MARSAGKSPSKIRRAEALTVTAVMEAQLGLHLQPLIMVGLDLIKRLSLGSTFHVKNVSC